MPERQPNFEEDEFDRVFAQVRSNTKKIVALEIAVMGISILGEKNGNDFLNEGGSIAANGVFILLAVSWANLWIRENLENSIDFLSKQIENNRKIVRNIKQKFVQ